MMIASAYYVCYVSEPKDRSSSSPISDGGSSHLLSETGFVPEEIPSVGDLRQSNG